VARESWRANGRATFGFPDDGNDLDGGKTGRPHAELSKNLSLKNSTFKRDHLLGGLPDVYQVSL
jgi:hypothetical protein